MFKRQVALFSLTSCHVNPCKSHDITLHAPGPQAHGTLELKTNLKQQTKMYNLIFC